MKELKDYLLEKLMVFGKKQYPLFGHVVILAGGAGSGKGFQLKNLIGVEGKVLDVDALKQLAIKSTVFAEKVKKEIGVDLKKLDMKVPENVSKIHEILDAVYNIKDKNQKTLFTSILTADESRKPNVIFDVTLANLAKLESISRNVTELGYEKKNVHLVWIVNDIEVAMEQNQKRDRVVPEEVLLSTHEGAALSMKKILDMGSGLRKYMDGTIFLSFNKAKVDVTVEKSKHGGQWIKKADYIKVKESGKSQTSTSDLGKEIYQKIKNYVPKVDTW